MAGRRAPSGGEFSVCPAPSKRRKRRSSSSATSSATSRRARALLSSRSLAVSSVTFSPFVSIARTRALLAFLFLFSSPNFSQLPYRRRQSPPNITLSGLEISPYLRRFFVVHPSLPFPFSLSLSLSFSLSVSFYQCNRLFTFIFVSSHISHLLLSSLSFFIFIFVPPFPILFSRTLQSSLSTI